MPVIELEAVTTAVTDAVASLGHTDVCVDGTWLCVAIDDPQRDTPDLVAAVAAAGGPYMESQPGELLA